jgi:hypothetical protein
MYRTRIAAVASGDAGGGQVPVARAAGRPGLVETFRSDAVLLRVLSLPQDPPRLCGWVQEPGRAPR